MWDKIRVSGISYMTGATVASILMYLVGLVPWPEIILVPIMAGMMLIILSILFGK